MRVLRTDLIERMIYAQVLKTDSGELVFDVGRTYQTAKGRMKCKRKGYNSWLTGYVNPKTGQKAPYCCFYDLIKELLGDEKWFVDSLPQVTMRVVLVDAMDDFQADLMEGYFQVIVHPECLNVQIGDGHGKAGGSTKNHFGCVYWNKTKTKKVFQAQFSLPTDRCAKRERNGQRKQNRVNKPFKSIEEAYYWVQARWLEHKDEPNFIGYKPPKTLQHYKNYLGNKYDELNYLLTEH